MLPDFDNRRIFRKEFAVLLGVGDTWLVEMTNNGKIPRGQRDPGGRREWWTAAQVKAVLAKILAEAEPAVTREVMKKPLVKAKPSAAIRKLARNPDWPIEKVLARPKAKKGKS